MTDYERGVEQASVVYKEVIREYVAENAKLRELVRAMWAEQEALPYGAHIEIRDRMRELGIEVGA